MIKVRLPDGTVRTLVDYVPLRGETADECGLGMVRGYGARGVGQAPFLNTREGGIVNAAWIVEAWPEPDTETREHA